jgi:murein L,D-transpeptidase YcbB/YkuD
MQGKVSVRVNLPKSIPVLIVYGTAFVEENGEVRFYRDLYGDDAALGRALAARHARGPHR